MPDVSSAGWVIFDPLTTSHLKSSFFELSGATAGSYKGELLGLTALHLVGCAFAELYGKPGTRNKMVCDNKRALHKAKSHNRRVPPAAKHGDLLRLLCNIKPALSKSFVYEHIYGHADQEKGWKQLTLIEKLNVFCGHLRRQPDGAQLSTTTMHRNRLYRGNELPCFYMMPNKLVTSALQ